MDDFLYIAWPHRIYPLCLYSLTSCPGRPIYYGIRISIIHINTNNRKPLELKRAHGHRNHRVEYRKRNSSSLDRIKNHMGKKLDLVTSLSSPPLYNWGFMMKPFLYAETPRCKSLLQPLACDKLSHIIIEIGLDILGSRWATFSTLLGHTASAPSV